MDSFRINLTMQDPNQPVGAIVVRTYDIPKEMNMEEAIKLQRFIQGFLTGSDVSIQVAMQLEERIKRAKLSLQQVHDDLNGYHEEVEPWRLR